MVQEHRCKFPADAIRVVFVKIDSQYSIFFFHSFNLGNKKARPLVKGRADLYDYNITRQILFAE